MDAAQPAKPCSATLPRAKLVLSVAGLLALAAVLLGYFRLSRTGPATVEGEEDPRLTFPTSYRNVRPEVRYVGDAACAACHVEHAERYHRHPMGRSLAPLATLVERYDAEVHNPFGALGFQFHVERRADRVFHKETLRDPQGQVVATMEAEAAFAVGSGTRGRSYLINRDGYLFQSPVTWFGQKNRWDLSPGFRFRFELFERPISPECLFCHSNYADHVEDTINRYREPVFHGHAIGCERCHGPGELHVRRREAAEVVEGLDDTIVNPRHLEPHLRDAVCEQCHLEGVSRVVRRGRAPFDYRPGLPVHLFWAIFVRPTEAAEAHTVVNHVEQMQASRCYQASQGKLGCISCHDPHERPVPEQQLAYYRARCLACHEDGTGRSLAATGRSTGCSLSPASRQKKDDNCFGCHMPRRDSSDIVHVAVTDHRVLRRAEDAGRPAGQHAGEMGRERSLVLFHRDEEQAGARELRRSLGLALLQQPGLDGGLGRQAVELLEEAVKDVPEDVAAWEGLGYALWKEGQPHAALEACEAALARAPRREFTLKTAAHVAAELKQHDRAIAYWQRALDVNPSPTSYRHQLAKLYAAKQDWEKAAAECQRVLQTNPAHPQTRLLLVSYYLRAGDRERARAEFERVLAFDPPNPEELRRWFAQQVR